MSVDLAPRDVAGVLDQLYRAANGVPRRFYLRSEDLRVMARRERALRPEFFEETDQQLEVVHSILMSYPRLGRGGVLGFVSSRVAESWPVAPVGDLRDALAERSDTDWPHVVRRRLLKLHKANQGDQKSASPMLITEGQLCRMAQKRRFEKSWWLEILEELSKAPVDERLTFFSYEGIRGRPFIITHEYYIRRWFHPTKAHWETALKRFELDEVDEDAAPRKNGS